jgi:hypothetical protein
MYIVPRWTLYLTPTQNPCSIHIPASFRKSYLKLPPYPKPLLLLLHPDRTPFHRLKPFRGDPYIHILCIPKRRCPTFLRAIIFCNDALRHYFGQSYTLPCTFNTEIRPVASEMPFGCRSSPTLFDSATAVSIFPRSASRDRYCICGGNNGGNV